MRGRFSIRAHVALLLLGLVHAGIASASDEPGGSSAARIYDPASGGTIVVEGEADLPPRWSGYLQGLKEPIQARWDPLVTSLRTDRKIPRCFTGVRRTVLAISVDAGGNARGLEVQRPSGIEALDEVAVLAVQRAQPLPHPPTDAMDRDALFRFTSEFTLRGDARWRAPRGLPSDPDVPVYANPCVTPPAAMDATCIASGTRLPADYTGETPGRISIKFVVGKDGVPGEVEVLTGGTPAVIQAAIRSAVAGCRWSPGLDETWAPKAMWVILPVKFVRPVDGAASTPAAAPATGEGR